MDENLKLFQIFKLTSMQDKGKQLVHHGVNKATIFNRQKAYCILVLTFDF
jgi:hypothetical protein